MRKLFTLSFAMLVAVVSFSQTDCSNLYFSEYVEGSSNNKAYEIYNPTSSSIDLSTYGVALFSNGKTTTTNVLVLEGMLAPGEVYCVVNANADSALLDEADTTHSTTYYNGDDALVLGKYNGLSFDTLDIIGVVGVDPGSNWTVGRGATNEHTLVRGYGSKSGNTKWTDNATKWWVYPQNEFSRFGSHNSSCQPKPVSLKELRQNDTNGVSIYNGETVWSSGVVNTATSYSSSAVNIYFQSGGYGIGTYITGLNYTPRVGDSITIYGTIGRFQGLTQFSSADSFEVVDSGIAVVPEVVDTLTEAKEGVLIKLEGLMPIDNKTWPSSGSNADFFVTDGVNTFNMRIDRDTDIDGRDTFNVGFDLVGILGQYDNDDNVYDKGYQIIPRNWLDAYLDEYDRTIEQLRIEDPNTHEPYLKGRIVRTRGIINNDVNLNSRGLTISMESNGWGMTLYGFSPVSSASGLKVGDSVEVVGEMDEFNGLAEVSDIDTIIVHSTGNMLMPEIVTELNEVTESRLVQIRSLNLLDSNDWLKDVTRDGNLDVANSTDTFSLRIHIETDVINNWAPDGMFNLTGIGTQYDNASDGPYRKGYQLIPRSMNDFDIIVGTPEEAELWTALYPNPTNGIVNISSVEAIEVLRVYNLVGSEVMSFTNVTNTIDLSDLEAGVYILQGTADSGAGFTTTVIRR